MPPAGRQENSNAAWRWQLEEYTAGMPNGVRTEVISAGQAARLLGLDEGQFADLKAKEIRIDRLSKAISALANTDGGDLYIGIRELTDPTRRVWEGFANEEAANGHVQSLERLFPLGMDYMYEFHRAEGHRGLVLHLQINKTQGIVLASDGIPYVRRGAQNLPVSSAEALRRLEFAKGIQSFETQLTNVPMEVVIESPIVQDFVRQVVPTTTPEAWLRKQVLIRQDKPTVAGVVLFTEEPQALIPKHCGIKVYRYKTEEAEGTRETLAEDPKTVEGCLYEQIKLAVEVTKRIVEGIPRLGESVLEAVEYPPEALHEIITNAVLHRDYSAADDVHIRIFDNRVEVQSPGRLPAHITVRNILRERFARNGAIVRILNKFPDPPNKDVGEGLNTAFEAMTRLGLKEPVIFEHENAVVVQIRHERLASPEEAIMDYLKTHEQIKNAEARRVTHLQRDYQAKTVFGRMVAKGLIEQVPGTRTSATAYRPRVVPESEEVASDESQREPSKL